MSHSCLIKRWCTEGNIIRFKILPHLHFEDFSNEMCIHLHMYSYLGQAVSNATCTCR